MQWKNKKIRSGDLVSVICGDAKGSYGRVLRVDRERSRIFVEGVNLCSKHVKPSVKDPDGGIRRKEASLHVSNVMLVDPVVVQDQVEGSRKQLTRVKIGLGSDGRRVRFAKRSGVVIGEKKNVVV
jgi:large subunit ribosomal protein L24